MVPKAFLSRFLEILSNFFIRCGLFILMHFLYFASEQYSYTVFKWTRMVLSCQIPGEFPLNFMIYFFFLLDTKTYFVVIISTLLIITHMERKYSFMIY